MRLPALLAALAVLSACAPPAQVTMNQPQSGVGFGPVGSLPLVSQGTGSASVSRNFMDLTFAMESGRELSTFTRFEGPITVSLQGDVPGTAASDLDDLLGRLRSEAGIDITRTSGAGRITVEFTTRSELRRLAPTAACFVVPNVSSLAEYRQKRGSDAVDWSQVTERRTAAIFIPADVSPQEVRDCMHEELSQALGPLNDLYRLADSIFNDDNFHSVLTGFDMEILRQTYSPALHSGMSRIEVAAALGTSPEISAPTSPAWIKSLETALGRNGSLPSRLAAAEQALALAKAAGWRDNRAALSYFAMGRLLAGSDPARAVEAFTAADAIYAGLPEGDLQRAHVDMQLAAIALANGRPEEVITLTDRAMPVVKVYENYALLTTLMLIKAEALDQLGDAAGAAALRLDSQPFASYGFGPDSVIRDRMREIASVAARGTTG